jgi:hypothetical protein
MFILNITRKSNENLPYQIAQKLQQAHTQRSTLKYIFKNFKKRCNQIFEAHNYVSLSNIYFELVLQFE